MKAADARRYLAAYQAHGTDGDAAEALGVRASAFRRWRVAFGLPDKDRFRPDFVPAIAFWVAYEDHRSDAASAAELGVAEGRFRKWRQGARLPRKVRPADAPAAVPKKRRRISDSAWQEAYDTTDTDAAMAKVVGATPGVAAAWRRRRGLPGASRRALEAFPGFDHKTWFAVWRDARDDHEAAAAVDVRLGVWRRWRKAWGLRPPPGR